MISVFILLPVFSIISHLLVYHLYLLAKGLTTYSHHHSIIEKQVQNRVGKKRFNKDKVKTLIDVRSNRVFSKDRENENRVSNRKVCVNG